MLRRTVAPSPSGCARERTFFTTSRGLAKSAGTLPIARTPLLRAIKGCCNAGSTNKRSQDPKKLRHGRKMAERRAMAGNMRSTKRATVDLRIADECCVSFMANNLGREASREARRLLELLNMILASGLRRASSSAPSSCGPPSPAGGSWAALNLFNL